MEKLAKNRKRKSRDLNYGIKDEGGKNWVIDQAIKRNGRVIL